MDVKVSGACVTRGRAVIDHACDGAVVVEVGALLGHLSSWCLSQRPDITWIMVDSWLPMDQQPESYIKTKDDHALHDMNRVLRHRSKAYENAAQSGASILHMTSQMASGLFGDGSIDVVFIDADHSYEGVRQDIEWWHPKVAPGGWIGGHDYGNPDPRFGGVDRAVDEAFNNVGAGGNFTWWNHVT